MAANERTHVRRITNLFRVSRTTVRSLTLRELFAYLSKQGRQGVLSISDEVAPENTKVAAEVAAEGSDKGTEAGPITDAAVESPPIPGGQPEKESDTPPDIPTKIH